MPWCSCVAAKGCHAEAPGKRSDATAVCRAGLNWDRPCAARRCGLRTCCQTRCQTGGWSGCTCRQGPRQLPERSRWPCRPRPWPGRRRPGPCRPGRPAGSDRGPHSGPTSAATPVSALAGHPWSTPEARSQNWWQADGTSSCQWGGGWPAQLGKRRCESAVLQRVTSGCEWPAWAFSSSPPVQSCPLSCYPNPRPATAVGLGTQS